jgi:toxin-antitoxin system PIN domain toxin
MRATPTSCSTRPTRTTACTPRHARCWSASRGGLDLFYLFWPTVMGFLRIVTHPAIFPRPYTPEEAIAAMASLLDRPNVRVRGEHDGFWELYRATAQSQTRGNHVPEAHLAALMRQHGVPIIYTCDRDFRRYDGVDARDPFA